MQVLGALIDLPKDSHSLPLPWWHRAPLGLKTGTNVFIALVEDAVPCAQGKRPVGDLIVSVIDPYKWNHLIRVECQREDEAGVIRSALSTIPKQLNVALAETVTVTGHVHRVYLVCEPLSENEDTTKYADEIERKLKELGFSDPYVKPAFQTSVTIKWYDVGNVEHGWLHKTDWKAALRKHYDDSELSKVDLAKVVVSADTRRRLLRYIFPLKGAHSITIQLRDAPGALEILTKTLATCQANVLSALLSRGGAKHTSCEVTMTCEPKDAEAAADLENKIKTAIGQIDPVYGMKVQLGPPKSIDRIIYPRHPDDVVARVPPLLRHLVYDVRSSIIRGKYPVFISRRFFEDSPRANVIRKTLHKILDENGCAVLEALPRPVDLASFLQVSSKMWASIAGIVIVAASRIKGVNPLSISLGHEYGFLQGQGKPILLLVEDGLQGSMWKWANANGINFQVFSNSEAAFDASKDKSLSKIITEWIISLTKEYQTSP